MGSRTMNVEAARRLADGATAKAEELGLKVSVAVVDPAGHVVHLIRMDGAGWFSSEIALGKAVAAAAFRRDTAELTTRFQGKEVFAMALTPLSQGKLVIGQGACVVRDGEDILGALGVSGAKSEEDEECAKAGIAHFLDGAAT